MAKRRSSAGPKRASLARRRPQLVRLLALAAVFLVAAAFGTAYGAWALVCRGGSCPAVSVLDEYQPRQTSKLYAMDGRFITEIGLERRTLVTIEQIPRIVQDAFVVTEDRRFYSHGGVDFIGLLGAVKDRLAGDRLRGASTITQQLARNVFPERISRERSLTRKLREARVAREIESRYPKQKILELYLNQISLGNGAFGVETAAQRYFGKSVRDLNIAEAATLAALPKGPERYNPRRYPERAIQRRNTVIELMRREEKISDADASLARAYPLRLAPREEAGDVAPYFVEWVRQQLDQHFGRRLYEQGLKVYTTLDLDMQSAAERALEGQLKAIEGGKFGAYTHTTYEKYIAGKEATTAVVNANTPYLQGAFVAMEPRTGAVRSLIGGRDFDDSKFNRATQALRQPGSTFKPVVYSDAIRNGRPPSYLVDDSPLSLPQADGSTWSPQNYDMQFQGTIPMRRALYMSRNLAAIRLGQELGERDVIAMARRFGISTPIPAYPSIHIGAADVYPIEMIAAYTTFATLGTRSAPYAIVRVENGRGEVLWQPSPVRAAVLSPEEAWLMVDMMKDVVRRGTAAGIGAQLGFPLGGKTGTTNDGADVWFIGYTSDLVAGVWMGMDRPRKIKGNAQGGVLAAPAFTNFMREVYRRGRAAPRDWPRPEEIRVRTIDRTNGLLENPYCPREVVGTEYYIAGTEPVEACQLHNEYNSTLTTDSTATALPPGTPVPAAPRDTANPFRLPP